jgi:predicted kinase
MTVAVIVTGPPASGKTTIAERLAADYELPLLTKDGVKETLFDTIGIGDLEFSKRLGAAAFAIVWHVLEQELAASRAAIVEGNFSAQYDVSRVERLQGLYELDLVQIHCHAPIEVLRDRYASRQRHPGHLDRERLPAIDGRLEATQYLLPIDAETVSIDTTQPDAYDRAHSLLRERAL